LDVAGDSDLRHSIAGVEHEARPPAANPCKDSGSRAAQLTGRYRLSVRRLDSTPSPLASRKSGDVVFTAMT